MAGDGPHQRSGLALGPQGGVDRPERALAGVGRAGPHHAGGQGGGDGERAVLVDPLGRLGDEDDVDVADVVQLAAAGLTHPDHGEPARLGARAVLLPGDGQPGLQRRLGEVGSSSAAPSACSHGVRRARSSAAMPSSSRR